MKVGTKTVRAAKVAIRKSYILFLLFVVGEILRFVKRGTLQRSPVRVGVCADADEAGNENGESGYGDEQKVVHTCLLVALANAALNPSGVVVVSSVRAVMRS